MNSIRIKTLLILVSLLFVSACKNGETTEEAGIPIHPSLTATVALTPAVDVLPYPMQTSALPVSPSPEAIETATPFSANVSLENQRRIKLWHSLNELQTGSLAEVIATFQESHPDIRVEEEFYPFDDLKSKFEQAARAEDGPAILLAPQEWIPDLYDAGLIEDLSDLVDEELLAHLTPVGLAGARFRGALPALPYRLDGVVLYRNQSVISEPAVTLEEFVEQAVVATRGSTIGAYLDLGPYFSLPHLAACGGQIMNEDGMPAFNNSIGICWLNLLRSFQEAGIPWVINSQDDAKLFKAGRVGIIIDEVSRAAEFSEAIGEENLAIDPWPDTAQGHLSGFVRAGVVMMGTGLEDEEREASQRLMNFLLLSQAQEIFADSEMAGFIPSVGSVEVNDRLIAEAYRAFQKGTALPLFSLDSYWDPLERAIRASLEADADLDQILEQAEEEILRGVIDINS